jgi:Rps23 Pro-64 3,4-dihydroxylase Tpa1-like proline 4-hydroxylase
VEIKELGLGLVSYSNVIKDNTIIDSLVNDNELVWKKAAVLSNNKSIKDYNSRDTDISRIPYSKNMLDETSSKNKLSNLLTQSFSPAINDYFNRYKVYTENHYEYSLLRYGVGQKFDEHVDQVPGVDRTISLVYFINDNYEGGTITFQALDVSIKPKSNQLIIFPSNYIYRHSVEEVTSGIRYSVVTWLV